MELSRAEARRLVLSAQGFGTRRPAHPKLADVRKLARRLRAVHIDSINVLVRSQYLVPYSRLGPYPIDSLDTLTYDRKELFEGSAVSTYLLPIELHPLLRYKMDGYRTRGAYSPNGVRIDPRFVDAVYEEVAARGPMSVKDLSAGGPSRGKWWGWSNGKTALEHLWRAGLVAIAGREDFTRLYDIAERVLPAEVFGAPAPAREEAQKQLLCLTAEMLGLTTAKGIAHVFGIHYDHQAMRDAQGRLPRPTWPRLVPQLVEEGRLVPVSVEGCQDQFYASPRRRIPGPFDRRALISPFDSLLAHAEPIFGFVQHLAQQLYVPASRREYGYYVLPFLSGDQLVGRCDLKADRQGRQLLVPAAYTEPGHDRRRVAVELAGELRQLQSWLGLDGVLVGDRGDLADSLRTALRRRSS